MYQNNYSLTDFFNSNNNSKVINQQQQQQSQQNFMQSPLLYPKLDPNNFFEKLSFQSLYSDFVSDSLWSTSEFPHKYIKNLTNQFSQHDNLSDMKESTDNMSEVSGSSNSNSAFSLSDKQAQDKTKKSKRILRLNDYMNSYYSKPLNDRLLDIFNSYESSKEIESNNNQLVAKSSNDNNWSTFHQDTEENITLQSQFL